MNERRYEINGHDLTLLDVATIAKAKKGETTVRIADSAKELMQKSRDYVLKIVEKGAPVYGINTGFGALASKHISKEWHLGYFSNLLDDGGSIG